MTNLIQISQEINCEIRESIPHKLVHFCEYYLNWLHQIMAWFQDFISTKVHHKNQLLGQIFRC